MAHCTHAVRPAEGGPKACAVTSTSRSSRLGGMASANIRRASATSCRSTPATNRRGTLAVNCLGVLRMHRCLARPVRVTHEPAEV
jgi:hypothetical protein